MKILEIKKNKNNYTIKLDDNTTYKLMEDTLIKYNLLTPRNIKPNELEEMLEYNNKIMAYDDALKYIGIKLRTKKEIESKLSNYGKDIIDYVIERLDRNGYLDSKVYIISYINDQINLTLNGPRKIENDLVKLGFDRADIEEYLDTFPDSLWEERVEKIKTKKINSNHNYSSNYLNKKINEYLVSLGYNKKISINIDDTSILIREYNKIYNKYKSKYEGIILDKNIKNYLYKKGFNISDIEKIMNN